MLLLGSNHFLKQVLLVFVHWKALSICYDLPVRLTYIVVTCARMFRKKRICCDPPCCLGMFSDIMSVHDTIL